MDLIEQVVLIVLGWLLALLTTPIVEAIKRRREIRETRSTLLAELNELKYRLAIVAYNIENQYGKLDKDFLKWVYPLVKDYSGPMPAKSMQPVIEKLLASPETELAAAVIAGRTIGTGLSLKRYPVPFLSSRLQSIAWLPQKIQRLLLEIHTQLGILDAEAETAQYYFRMIFDASLTGDNRAVVKANLEEAYINYGSIAKLLVDRITEVEAGWD